MPSAFSIASWMPSKRPNHGCHRYSSSRNSVPWVFSSLVVQHRASALEPRLSDTGGVRGKLACCASTSRARRSVSAGNGPGRCGKWGLRVPSRCRNAQRGANCEQTQLMTGGKLGSRSRVPPRWRESLRPVSFAAQAVGGKRSGLPRSFRAGRPTESPIVREEIRANFTRWRAKIRFSIRH